MSDSNAYNLHLHKIVLVMPQSTIILVIRKGLTIIYHKLVMGQIKMYQVKMVYQLKMVYQVNIVYQIQMVCLKMMLCLRKKEPWRKEIFQMKKKRLILVPVKESSSFSSFNKTLQSFFFMSIVFICSSFSMLQPYIILTIFLK